MTKPLQDRVALVTGAGSGIGAATAGLLAGRGATVWCADLDEDAAGRVAVGIADAGGQAVAHPVDVTDEASNDALVAAVVAAAGRLDAVHLNAGVATGVPHPIHEVPVEHFDRLVAVNLRSVFLGLRAAGRVLVDLGSGGAIAVTASLAGLLGSAGTASYSATKHGVLGLVKVASVDLAAHGIRVNAVCPGIVDTPIHEARMGKVADPRRELDASFGPGVPMGRVAGPDEVASIVAFLLSDEASYVTGSAYTVDGGVSSVIGSFTQALVGSR